MSTATESQECIFVWNGCNIRLKYQPLRWNVIDHLTIQSIDGDPLPITETGFKSHFFGSIEPSLNLDEARDMVIDWLNDGAKCAQWKAYVLKSQQMDLFGG